MDPMREERASYAGEGEGAEETAVFPWPPPESADPLAHLVATWRESVFRPTPFFRAMPRTGGLGGPVLYFLIIGIVAAAMRLFWRMTLGTMAADSDAPALRVLRLDQGAGSPLVDFLMTPLMLLLTLALATLFVHAALWLTGGARHGMGTTTRVFCYTAGPGLFAIVPVLGGLVGAIWSLVILVIGLREAHETTTGRATLAVLLPVLIFVGIFVLLLLAIMATGAATLLPEFIG
jgi:hypothetical protein